MPYILCEAWCNGGITATGTCLNVITNITMYHTGDVTQRYMNISTTNNNTLSYTLPPVSVLRLLDCWYRINSDELVTSLLRPFCAVNELYPQQQHGTRVQLMLFKAVC
jgi:hypothetical protein